MKEEPPSTNAKPYGLGFMKRFFRITKSFYQKISYKPKDKVSFLVHLKDISSNGVIEKGTLSMLEGALKVSTSKVRDIMIPKTQMIMVDSKESLKDFYERIIESGHSRYPIFDSDINKIIGILLAKDLLSESLLGKTETSDFSKVMRPVVLIPESKKLNTLLDEFRMNRNHMAIVIDEYGEVTGLVTIEDVLEEIVGEIEDETDDQLNKMIERNKDGSYLVSALTPIEDFNLEFNSNLLKEDFDTLGGILSHHFGKIPKKNDSISIESLQFFIESTEKRRIKKVRVIKLS
tara:strand:- start:24895 stop:25764 length:870 start_codon:yes stop_codon:yes gene_type:complete